MNAVNEYGQTALMLASDNDHPEVLAVVSALLAARADVNAADQEGKTPLMFASDNGRPEVVKARLAAGAGVDAKRGRRKARGSAGGGGGAARGSMGGGGESPGSPVPK